MLIYQIYPRSFQDSNGDGIGDLNGITARLDYVASLGVEWVWISPFFKSPQKDFGYDVSDYLEIDPLFGDMNDFYKLMQKANALGLKIMIDMVLSHSSDQHPWFVASKKNRVNTKADWYVWSDKPNNWKSLFGGGAWEWCEERGQYYLHNFLREQPDFNFHNPELQGALLEICEFWFSKGVKGFRLDVCNFYFHDPLLKDNPLKGPSDAKTEGVQADNPYNQQWHIYDKDQDENLFFLRRLRSLSNTHPGSVLMGEIVSDNSLKLMKSYINNKEPLHTAYNFSLFNHGFDALKVAETINSLQALLPAGLPTWALGNHDVPRFVSRWGAGLTADAAVLAKLFLSLLFSLRGNLAIYQGDELGLLEAEVPFAQMQDPFGLAFYPEFKGRDGCRTPFPWDTNLLRTSWLPQYLPHLQQSVERQEADANSVLHHFRKLTDLRYKIPSLTTAPIEARVASEQVLLIFRPEFIAGFNFNTHSVECEIPAIGTVKIDAFDKAFYALADGQWTPMAL